MDTIECGICFDSFCEKDLQYLDCFHSLCFDCYRRLLSLTCPFCRAEININSDLLECNIRDQEDIFSFDDIFLGNDFIISGRNRKNRQENKRKKINKKKEQLNIIINNNISSSLSSPILIPNSRIRSNRKNRN